MYNFPDELNNSTRQSNYLYCQNEASFSIHINYMNIISIIMTATVIMAACTLEVDIQFYFLDNTQMNNFQISLGYQN